MDAQVDGHRCLIDTIYTHPTRGGIDGTETAMIKLKVTGMTCGHCENAVRKALASVAGVTEVVTVDRTRELVEVEGAAEVAALVAAVVEEGYTAVAA